MICKLIPPQTEEDFLPNEFLIALSKQRNTSPHHLSSTDFSKSIHLKPRVFMA
jgi:hypothetical protein